MHVKSDTINQNNNEKVIYLLWTGGWDSTFRLIHLVLVEKVKVQPYYIIEIERKSFLYELAAILKIREKILEKDPISATLLLPTRIYLKSEIAECSPITKKFQSLSSRFRLGSQFEWLPRFAEQNQMKDIELAIEKNQMRPRDPVFEYLGRFLIEDNGILKLATTLSDNDMQIFKYFHFPIYSKTKLQMLEISLKEGFDDIMFNSWFCHRPKRGQPCGQCHPCMDAMEEGFAFRLTVLAKCRYYFCKFLQNLKARIRAVKLSIGDSISK
ncbi:hypothetical protein [Desulfobacterium sp. N47]|uniref:hypothetical protein n=1 Tax=Desulfobacterium sp. N47 TaxID=3115210 RepID=UPI003F4A1906